MTRMTHEESEAWRPEIEGWSTDILPFYREAVATLPVDARCVEVGCYQGRSLIFLAEELKRQGKHRALVWGFDPGIEDPRECYPAPDGHSVFWNSRDKLAANVTRFGDRVGITTSHEASPSAANAFSDASLDIVFLDGDHRRVHLMTEIQAWAKKLRPGGILGGHDYAHSAFAGVKEAVDEMLTGVHVEDTVWWAQLGGSGVLPR